MYRIALLTLPFLGALACAPREALDINTPPGALSDTALKTTFGEISTDFTGRCFTETTPKTETRIITEQVEVIPAVIAPDGSVTSPPVFRNQTRPVTQEVASGQPFETLCTAELTPERVATLQRALKARLAFDGPITGTYDAQTRFAVQAFQALQGFDSPLLARSIAQTIGLVAIDATDTNAFTN